MAAAPSTAPESAKDPAAVTVQRPIRMCIGCRQRAPAAELLRVVAGPGGEPVPDPRRRIPGRGAWLCQGEQGGPDQRCTDAALRRNAFSRALRGPVNGDAVKALRANPAKRARMEGRHD